MSKKKTKVDDNIYKTYRVVKTPNSRIKEEGFEVRVEIKNKKNITFYKTLEAARNHRDKLRESKVKPIYKNAFTVDTPEYRFGDICNDFLEWLLIEGRETFSSHNGKTGQKSLEKGTVKHYKTALKRFGHLGKNKNKLLGELTKDDFKDWEKGIEYRDYAEETLSRFNKLKKYIIEIREIQNFNVNLYINPNITFLNKKSKEVVYFKDDQLNDMENFFDTHVKSNPVFFNHLEVLKWEYYIWNLIAKFMRLTKCRPGEAVGLSWIDIDFHKKKICLSRSANNDEIGPLKDKTPRDVDFDDDGEVLYILKEMEKHKNSNILYTEKNNQLAQNLQFVFPFFCRKRSYSKNGGQCQLMRENKPIPRRFFSQMWAGGDAFGRIGIQKVLKIPDGYDFYTFKHTGATTFAFNYLCAHGFSEEAEAKVILHLMNVMGHSDRKTAECYINTVKEISKTVIKGSNKPISQKRIDDAKSKEEKIEFNFEKVSEVSTAVDMTKTISLMSMRTEKALELIKNGCPPEHVAGILGAVGSC